MKRMVLLIWFLTFLSVQASDFSTPKVLHLSLHQGCINDIKQVAHELGWQLTSWRPLDSRESAYRFLGSQLEHPMAVYNLSHERAERAFTANEGYFNQFDMIITSDTAQLSRVFLQNGWRRPLVIWVCNRFNYCVGPGAEKGLGEEYYDLFRAAMKMPNVRVVSYTPFETYFAALYGVDIRGHLIKPIGSREGALERTSIPSWVQKKETIFIYPGYPGCDQKQLQYIVNECGSLGFKAYCGRYNGPDDLMGFKGVIFFPYQASNMCLFENIQRGIVHFVPSERFIAELIKEGAPIYYWYEPYYCEWYLGEHRDIFVYFDSWDDLKNKVAQTDFKAISARVRAFAQYHRNTMLGRWRRVFEEVLSNRLSQKQP